VSAGSSLHCEQALFQYLLRLGDSSLVLGQRLAECCGRAPMLEEEMALSNLALDLIGQARLLLAYAGELEAAGRDEDALAMHRDVSDFRSVLLVEQPNRDFAHTMLRQYFYASFAHRLFDALQGSADRRLGEIAGKAVKECRYHASHSGQWVVRLGDGTDESRRRMIAALEELWPYTGELFHMDEVDQQLIRCQIAVDLQALSRQWLEELEQLLQQASLPAPPRDAWMQGGGKTGNHSEHLGHLLATMQFLPRAYPDARW